MSERINIEITFFLISILWGVLIVFFYDILRIFRRIIKQNIWIVSVQDLLFWLVSAIFIFGMMYKMNYGIIRAFSIVGMLFGMIVYHYFISNRFVEGISFLLHQFIRGIVWILRLIFFPFQFLCNKIKIILRFLSKKLKKIKKFVTKMLKKQAKTVKITKKTK